MSAEPDNTIEKALRDYARKRREQPGAPEGLHAANRRLLQAEVQRSYGASSHPNPQVEKRLAWWFRWQGLASLGTAVIALCGVVVWWAYQDSSSQMQLAQGALPLQTSDNRRNLSEATDQNQLSLLTKRTESEPNLSRFSSVPTACCRKSPQPFAQPPSTCQLSGSSRSGDSGCGRRAAQTTGRIRPHSRATPCLSACARAAVPSGRTT